MGIPQYAAVMGNCVAGGAYLPVLSDTLLMTEGSQLYLAGPALVKAAIGQTADPRNSAAPACTPNSAARPTTASRTTTPACARLRSLIDLLPSADRRSRMPSDRYASAARSRRICTRLSRRTAAREYDARDLLACLVDAGFAAGIPGRIWPHRGDGLRPDRRPAGRRGGQPAAAMPLGEREKCRSAACCTAIRPRRRPAS